MWLPDRRLFLLSALALGACGYEPVYAPGGSGNALTGQIEVAAPDTRNGFDLVRQLETRLGQPQSPRYALRYTIDVDQDELGIAPTQEITRYNLVGQVSFTVTEISTGIIATSGRVDNFTAYSATGTTLSTQTARRDAHSRLMLILADQITARLLATSSDWAG